LTLLAFGSYARTSLRIDGRRRIHAFFDSYRDAG
jgi:hypothetical protein